MLDRQTLRQWSSKEKRKRASARRQSTLVMPVPPADLAAIGEGISTLSRKGSALIRSSSSASSRRSSAKTPRKHTTRPSIGSMLSHEVELDERLPQVEEEDVHSPSSSPALMYSDRRAHEEDASSADDRVLNSGSMPRPSSAFVEDLPPQAAEPLARPRMPDAPRHSFQSLASDPFGDRHATPPRIRVVGDYDDENTSPGSTATPYGGFTGSKLRSASAFQPLEGEDEEGVFDPPGQTSVLDWLLCGCFGRPLGHEDQEARTNPME